MFYQYRNFCPYGLNLEAPLEMMGAFSFARTGNSESRLTKLAENTQMMLWLARDT